MSLAEPRSLPADNGSGSGLFDIIAALKGVAGRHPIASIEDTEPHYRKLLEAIDVAVYTTDAQGRINYYNEAAARFWGRRPEMGEEWCGSLEILWPDGRPMPHDQCPMAIALRENREVRGGEAIAVRPDGTQVSFRAHPTPLRSMDGALVGAVNVLVDITDRAVAENALRAAAESLRASNAVKDEFLGLVSHELRTPVTTIFGNARLLEDRGDTLSDEYRQSMIADIAADSERLLGIVENLLLLTKLESSPQIDLEPQVLGHVIRSSVEGFRQKRPGRDVALNVEDGVGIVDADRTYLELLMDNLLTNAHKYSPPATPIEVEVTFDDGEARVSVLDRGIGIAEEEIPKLFTPFYRSAAAKATATGIGVGLAVCRRVVEIQGGRIWASPRDGGGSELGFALPHRTLVEPD
jgi:PAS domain S-box-containing protein